MPYNMGHKLTAMGTNLEGKEKVFSNQLDPNVYFLSRGARCPRLGKKKKKENLTPLLPPTS